MKATKGKTEETVRSCLQCEGDEMLEVRKHASEAFTIMDMLSQQYGDGHGVSIVDFVRALIEAESDQRRLVLMIRADAERRLKEIENLIAGLRFVSQASTDQSGGISVGGKSITLQLSEIFRVAIERLRSLSSGDRGLVDGKPTESVDRVVMPCVGERRVEMAAARNALRGRDWRTLDEAFEIGWQACEAYLCRRTPGACVCGFHGTSEPA